jgi:NTP pyrophosphatase (non-canonical NTP hydrolase)
MAALKGYNMNYMIDKLATHNEPEYNEGKLIEELAELMEVIMKRKNKVGCPKQPTIQDLIDELGDVEMRVAIYKKMLGLNADVDIRIGTKLNKFADYLQDNKYGNRI